MFVSIQCGLGVLGWFFLFGGGLVFETVAAAGNRDGFYLDALGFRSGHG
jgi:hypothetical protein